LARIDDFVRRANCTASGSVKGAVRSGALAAAGTVSAVSSKLPIADRVSIRQWYRAFLKKT